MRRTDRLRLGGGVRLLPYVAWATVVAVAVLGDGPPAPLTRSAGCIGLGSSAVGGVAIDASGALRQADRGQLASAGRLRREAMIGASGDVNRASPMRKVSLARLQQALVGLGGKTSELPAEVALLAGLQRIEYVLACPAERDVVVAGYAEGWKVDDRGNVVGRGTGRPPLLLDDLLVALRTARQYRGGLMSCSIDPTEEGIERLREFVGRLRSIGNPSATQSAVERVLGPQRITVEGVPPTTHFAQVMVAADYRMKRLGMGLEASPVSGLTSYLELAAPGEAGLSAVAPRWWLAPDIGRIEADEAGLLWRLEAASVKAMTEDTEFSAEGATAAGGPSSAAARRWAELMTAHYDELAQREPIFAELRNVMELAVVAALIVEQRLCETAGLKLTLLVDEAALPTARYAAPRHTASQASAVKKGNLWVISASGGVQIDAAGILRQRTRAGTLGAVGTGALPEGAWWWD